MTSGGIEASPASAHKALCSFPEKNGFVLQVYTRFSGRQVRTKFAAEASGWDPITPMTASAIISLAGWQP
jgi:hypothetical protein